jgi:hypothetical protein
MQSLLETATLQELKKSPYVTHQQLLEPEFMKEKRESALIELKTRPRDDLQQAHQAYLHSIKTELFIKCKIERLLPAERQYFNEALEKYFKEINLYRQITESKEKEIYCHPTENEWIVNLDESSLALVADLIADL